MRQTSHLLSIRSIDTTQTLVVTIRGASYRSSEEDQLLALRWELEAVAAQLETAHHVIVDLSQVAVFGSSFLRVVFDALAPLRLLGIQTLLCGDRHGLVVLTAIEHWITVVNSLDEALDRTEEYDPRRESLPPTTRQGRVVSVA